MNIVYGRFLYGRWIYAGKAGGGTAPEPIRPLDEGTPFIATAYAKDGTKTAIFGSEVNALNEATFEMTETGCGQATIKFSKLPTTAELNYRQRIDFSLYGDTKPWWSGYVMQRPVDGTTAGANGELFEFKLFGFYNLLDKVIITKTYAASEVSEIAKDIAQQVENKVGLEFLATNFISTDYTISKIVFDHQTVKDCLKQLCEFAINYVYGVDENRRMYFKPRNDAINEQARFWVGEHLNSYKPTWDADKIVNHIYVKGGQMNASGENWLAEVQDDASIEEYGWCEDTMDLPEAYTEEDAERWALNQLENLKNPQKSAKVTGVKLEYPNADGSFNVRRLSVEGKAAITDKNGDRHEYPITKIKYSFSASKGVSCDLTLGTPPTTIDKVLAKIEQDHKNSEALQAANNKQLR